MPAGDNSKYASTDKRGPNQGVGAFCKELIVEGKTNAEVLAAVAEKFPTAKTSKGCVAYYRTSCPPPPKWLRHLQKPKSWLMQTSLKKPRSNRPLLNITGTSVPALLWS